MSSGVTVSIVVLGWRTVGEEYRGILVKTVAKYGGKTA